jgi:transcriptional antiterminator RfaH
MSHWYLIRTKTGGERMAEQQLARFVDSTLLPLGKMQIRQQDRVFERVAPLFPCYLFAFFSLATSARKIRYTPGVREIVQFGDQAALVPDWVIDHLMLRCDDGPVALSTNSLCQGAAVKLVGGPFREFDAIFDGYLGGAERVAVLLSVMNGERRVVVPTAMVVPAQ